MALNQYTNARGGKVSIRKFTVDGKEVSRAFVTADRYENKTKFYKDPPTLYKVVTPSLESWSGGTLQYEVGQWQVLDTTDKAILACNWGLHCTTAKDLGAWLREGYRLFEIETAGPVINYDNKSVVAALRLVREIPVTDELVNLAGGRTGHSSLAEKIANRKVNYELSFIFLERAMKHANWNDTLTDEEKALAAETLKPDVPGHAVTGVPVPLWNLILRLRARQQLYMKLVGYKQAEYEMKIVEGELNTPEKQKEWVAREFSWIEGKQAALRRITRVLRINPQSYLYGGNYSGYLPWPQQEMWTKKHGQWKREEMERLAREEGQHTLQDLLDRTVGEKQKRGV